VRAITPRVEGWVFLNRHWKKRRLGRRWLGLDGPVDDPDQVEDRELEDEHQEDDLDHGPSLRSLAPESLHVGETRPEERCSPCHAATADVELGAAPAEAEAAAALPDVERHALRELFPTLKAEAHGSKVCHPTPDRAGQHGEGVPSEFVSRGDKNVLVHVTVTRTKDVAGQPLEIARMAGEEMLRWLRPIDGFEGLLVLSNDEGSTLVISFWESREVAEEHRAARMRLRDRVTTMVNVEVQETTDYDVMLAELPRAIPARRAGS
jgi:hypothetical protein